MSLDKVAMQCCHEVLMEGGSKSALIVEDPQGILCQQHRPRPIDLIRTIIIKTCQIIKFSLLSC